MAVADNDTSNIYNVGIHLGYHLYLNGERKEGLYVLMRSYETGKDAGCPGAEDVEAILKEIDSEQFNESIAEESQSLRSFRLSLLKKDEEFLTD